jgi:thiosulfate dehydrogenase [quinone] large subunit
MGNSGGRLQAQPLSPFQQVALVLLRTLIGWHFLYEGYYKLVVPGWSQDGAPIGAWSSAGYLKGATGPLARVFQRLLDAGWIGWIDNSVKIGLVLVGASLILGLFTRVGAIGALLLLFLFYFVAIPLAGTQVPGSEGAYLIVNKTLIEAAAVCVLLAFNTQRIAGLDLLFANIRVNRASQRAAAERSNAEPGAPAVTATVRRETVRESQPSGGESAGQET